LVTKLEVPTYVVSGTRANLPTTLETVWADADTHWAPSAVHAVQVPAALK